MIEYRNTGACFTVEIARILHLSDDLVSRFSTRSGQILFATKTTQKLESQVR